MSFNCSQFVSLSFFIFAFFCWVGFSILMNQKNETKKPTIITHKKTETKQNFISKRIQIQTPNIYIICTLTHIQYLHTNCIRVSFMLNVPFSVRYTNYKNQHIFNFLSLQNNFFFFHFDQKITEKKSKRV